MKVIKKGHLPEATVYRAECLYCRTVFEFEQREARRESTVRNEEYLKIACPLCKRDTWVEM